MTTYTFTAMAEEDLLTAGDNNLGVGDTFTMPSSASVTFTVEDDDAFMSGDNWSNENANDSSGQTASITTPGGNEIGNGGQIYAESYYWVYDQDGNWYVMIEIEQEGSGDDYFTFYNGYGYTTPDAGTELTICGQCNVTCDWVDFKCLDGGGSPASISGTFFQDENHNSVDDAGDTDIDGATVELYAWDGSSSYFAGTATTDEDGDYTFEDLAEGWYYVRFVNPNSNAEFVGKDAGSNDAIDSDVNSGGYTSWIWLDNGEDKIDIDAGIKVLNTLEDGDEASSVCEDDGVVTLINVLMNTTDPEAGDPFVMAVWDEDGPSQMNVGEPIAGSNGGIFIINADGSITFDTNEEFEYLADGQSTTTEIWYCVQDQDGKIVESRYVVTVNGKDEAPEIAAADDFIVVLESETAGTVDAPDQEEIFNSFDDADADVPMDPARASILENDGVDGTGFTGAVVEVNGVSGNVGQFIELDKGRVKVNSDGTVDFDADGDFDALNEGDSEFVQLNYTITETVDGDVETPAKRTFSEFDHGDIVSNGDGYTVHAVRRGQSLTAPNMAMIFDSSLSGTADPDLEVNDGNLLIISEDGVQGNPDDNAGGGTFVFDFDKVSSVESVKFVDIEGSEPGEIRLYDAAGTLLSTTDIIATGDGGKNTQSLDTDGVAKMEIELTGSGAIDFVKFGLGTETEISETATINIRVDGENPVGDEVQGTITNDDGQKVVFIIDHSARTMNGLQTASAPNLNTTQSTDDPNSTSETSPGRTTAIDQFLFEILKSVIDLETGDLQPDIGAGRQIEILLMGKNEDINGQPIDNPVIAEWVGTAGDLKAAYAATGTTDDQKFAGIRNEFQVFNEQQNLLTELDVALALEAAYDRITEVDDSGVAQNPDGNVTDNVVILTSTNGVDGVRTDLTPAEGGEGFASTISPFTVYGFTESQATEKDARDELVAIGAEIDSVYFIDETDTDKAVLQGVDTDGAIETITTINADFGLNDLLANDTVIAGIEVDGQLFKVFDDGDTTNDLVDTADAADIFQFSLSDVTVDTSALTATPVRRYRQ